MNLEKRILEVNQIRIPALCISNNNDVLAVVIHGYGGNKEEIFGLSSYLSCNGVDTVTVDLRGHGENDSQYTIDVMEDINLLVQKFSGKKKVMTIGHSLGGRLALLAGAEARIGISPALSRTYSDQTRSTIVNLRKYRVKEEGIDNNFKILAELPAANLSPGKSLVLYGSRDVPEIKEACVELENRGANVVRIENALHNDIFLLKETFSAIGAFTTKQLS